MNFHAKQFIGRPGPTMAIEIDVHIEWPREPSFFLGLSGQMSYGNVVLSDTVRFEKASYWGDGMSGSTFITRDRGNYGGKLIIPVRNEALRYIEDNRHDQDVPLRVDLSYVWQEAIPTPVEKEKPPRYIAGSVRSDTGTVYDCVIKRSDWLKRLAEMKWQEYQLFEVAKLPLLSDPNLEVALERLVAAQTSLRSGDYTGVMTKCYAAFESAAKHESAGDKKKGFEQLLARAFKGDNTKQDAMNELIKRLSDYAQHGRHEQYPPVHIAREEAEFVFTTSIALFSLLSRRVSST